MVAWFLFFGALFVCIPTIFHQRSRQRRLVGQLQYRIDCLEKAVTEWGVVHNCVHTHMINLATFVTQFVRQDYVDVELRHRAERLDAACKRAIEEQSDPDKFLQMIRARDEEVTQLKVGFWQKGVDVIKLANDALGGLGQFTVPKKYSDCLKAK